MSNIAYLQKISDKTGVPIDCIVGPFTTRPPRNGMYIRVGSKKGLPVWAVHTSYGFGLYAPTKERAEQRKFKRSRKNLPWYGVTQGYHDIVMATKNAKKTAKRV